MARQVPQNNPDARIAFNKATLERLRGVSDLNFPGQTGGIIGKLYARIKQLETAHAELSTWNANLERMRDSGVTSFRDIPIQAFESRDLDPDPLPDPPPV